MRCLPMCIEHLVSRAAAAALALALGACATSSRLPQVEAWLEMGATAPPPQRACPYVADVDLHALARREMTAGQVAQRETARRYMRSAVDRISIPPSSPYRPGEDASVILRAVSPPGGLYSNTMWSVLWRDGDGVWWFWKQNRTTEAPPPPPPPDTQEYRDYMERFPNGIPSDDIRWPPETGRLHPGQAAALDHALNDPCRAWEPDIWPSYTPLARGSREPPPPPPQDSTSTYVELQEGQRVRFIAGRVHGDSLQGAIVSIAAYPR